MSAAGFAVVDVETTGLVANSGHRIIEIAVVHVEVDGTISGTWETLVNPKRDLGPQRIHGIAAADIMDAPSFADIAPELAELLAGRTLVAHNASFDLSFLIAEFERAGMWFTARPMCTMQLAREFIPGAGRSLRDCCDAYGIEIETAHRASADAVATAELLSAYIADSPMWSGWREHSHVVNVDVPTQTGVAWRSRHTASERSATFLSRISEKLPEFGGPADHLDYLALLDRALLDMHISAHEANALVEIAESQGISRATVADLHHGYFDQLTAVAWSDGVLTADEQEQLVTVGLALGLEADAIEAAMIPRALEASPVPAYQLVTGDLIVLTGEMQRSREEWHHELEARGFVPWSAVTKKVKLVAAADPDSLSGKARKARDYGIPIVGEQGLIDLLSRR